MKNRPELNIKVRTCIEGALIGSLIGLLCLNPHIIKEYLIGLVLALILWICLQIVVQFFVHLYKLAAWKLKK